MKIRLITEDGEIYEWRNVETIEQTGDKLFLFPPRENEQLLSCYYSEALIKDLIRIASKDYVVINIYNDVIECMKILF